MALSKAEHSRSVTASPQQTSMDIALPVERRLGKWQLLGRYQKLPRKLEDDYELSSKVLGFGLSGSVRLATRVGDSSRGQRFAVKAFPLTRLRPKAKAQLESEVQIFLGVDHPHIARLVNVYESEESLSLVMECMDGGELFDRVTTEKRLKEPEAVDITRQMLLAVSYLHSHNIAHRDLKLENFIFDKERGSYIKLIDFGFSKFRDPDAKLKTACGTLSYVAPEVLLERGYGTRCDVWSLGVIAYVLVAGCMPFAGEDDDMRKCIIRGKFSMSSSRWGTVSTEAKAFIQALMQPDPSERISAQSALGHGWITKHYQAPNPRLDRGLVSAMSDYAKASTLRRCCLNAMAWHLSNDETIQIRDAFLALDGDFSGTLTQSELQDLMVGSMPPDEAAAIFMAIDANHDLEVHYSEFLAAVMCRNVKISDDILQATFRKFDLDLSGLITAADLKALLGESFEGRSAEGLIEEAVGLREFGEDGHLARRGGIAFDDFARLVCGDQGVCPIGSVPNVSDSMVQMTSATFAASQAYSKEYQKHQKVIGLLGNLDGVKSAGGGKDVVKLFSPVQRDQPRIESTDAATPGCHCTLQ